MSTRKEAKRERNAASILDALSDRAIFQVTADGRIIWANRGAEILTARDRAELIGAPVLPFFDAAGQRRLSLAAGARRVTQDGARLLRLTTRDGRELWVSLEIHALEATDDVVLVLRDATAERARRAEEQRLRRVMEGVHDYAICGLAPDGTITEWNGAAERVLGYTPEEILGRHFSLFLTATDRAAGQAARALSAALRDETFEIEGWRVRKDGGRFWAWVIISALYDEDDELTGYAYTIRDITERRVAQEALRQSEQQFRLLVNGVRDHALYMLDPNGIVVSWNAGAQRIKGYAANEVIGQHYAKFYTETDRAAGLPAQFLHMAMMNGRHELEGWRVRKDGSLFWANVVISAIKDEKGKLVGFAKITRDITERRQAQLELSRTQERLSHAQKLEALGQLSGGIAHDFNNLLMVIGGQAQALRKAKDQPARLDHIADVIEAASERGGALTRQMLSFARRQHITRSTIAVADRLGGFREILTKALGSSAALMVDLPADLWPVDVDANEFELAVMNLAVNARDAMPSGGTLSISAENLMLQAGDIGPDLAGEFVAIRFTDTGQGIPPDILPSVFDPFFTTKPIGKGTGLGLSQVYGFALQAGGMATAASVLGEGANVTLYLPRGRTVEAVPPGAASSPLTVGGDVLLVEDNPEVAEVTAMLLEQLGFRVRPVQDAQAALDALESPGGFVLVVTDVVMAGPMDGLALAQVLKEQRPSLPVLLVSGYAKSFNDVGDAFPILQKPFKVGDLDRAISTAIAAVQPAESANVIRLSDVRRTP